MEVTVNKKLLQTTGAKLLVKKFKNNFRIPENINYYSKEDYQRAEKSSILMVTNLELNDVISIK
jgi:hypothetical protein